MLGCPFGDGRWSDELWVLTVWELFAIAWKYQGGIIANLSRLMQPQKKRIWKWSQPPTTQLWAIATRVRIAHTPLCTVSVNDDCRDEFAVCHGVYARSRELNFLTVVLRFYGSQLCVSIIMAFRRQESCIIPLECEKRLHDCRICSDLKKLKGFCCVKRKIHVDSELDQNITYACQNHVAHITW